MTKQLKETVYITKHLDSLQNAFFIPLGLFMFAKAMRLTEWGQANLHGGVYYFLVILLLIGLHPVIKDYYRKHFGRVDVGENITRKAWIRTLIAITIIGLLFLDAIYRPPVVMYFIAIACCFFYMVLKDVRRFYYLLPGLVFLVFAFSPQWETVKYGARYLKFGDNAMLVHILAGVIFIILAALDHLTLRRAFASAQKQLMQS